MILFIAPIFLSAFLLFLIQPLINRYILPWFGGTSDVWSASLLFFQLLILGGYTFAHWVASKKTERLWVYILILSGTAIFAMVTVFFWGYPLLVWPFGGQETLLQPLARVFAILSVSVGLPGFTLAVTSPLLQSWMKNLYPDRSPYVLYGVSNLGSLLGLATYPFVFEPLLRLADQAWLWYGCFLACLIFLFLAAVKMKKSQYSGQENQFLPQSRLENKYRSRENVEKNGLTRLFWVGLPACSSILLISITHQLTQEVAVVPFLWVLPLSLYLLSYVITFAGEQWYLQFPVLILFSGATLMVGYALNLVSTYDVVSQILVFSAFLFFSTLACHGELYRLRPDSEGLTRFYLLVSLGGVLGGVFASLAAPILFSGYWELHLGTLFAWIFVLAAQFIGEKSFFRHLWAREGIPVLLILLGVSGYVFYRQAVTTTANVLEMERNFYGVLRVRETVLGDPPQKVIDLKHGTTSHGIQFVDPKMRSIPTTYYGYESGVGIAITAYRNFLPVPKTGIRIGVVGLGVGTLAAYGSPEDYFRFYELNPDVVRLAADGGQYFSFLEDTRSPYDIVIGDARVSMERELAQGHPQAFDIIVLDAFSSDAIPTHLLTQEALNIYQQHLKSDGVLAFHISNRYLDLAPLIGKLASNCQLQAVLIKNRSNDQLGTYAADWVLVSANEHLLADGAIKVNASPISFSFDENQINVWTDDYSGLFAFLKADVLHGAAPEQ